MAGTHPRDVYGVIDEGKQISATFMDVRRVFLIFRIAGRPQPFVADCFREPENGIERRSEFVIHIRDELFFGLSGFFSAFCFVLRKRHCIQKLIILRFHPFRGIVESDNYTKAEIEHERRSEGRCEDRQQYRRQAEGKIREIII